MTVLPFRVVEAGFANRRPCQGQRRAQAAHGYALDFLREPAVPIGVDMPVGVYVFTYTPTGGCRTRFCAAAWRSACPGRRGGACPS